MKSSKLAMMSLCTGLAVSAADAQVFQRHVETFSEEKDFDQWQTTDGGYVTTGYRLGSVGLEDLLVTKYDKDGLVVWQTVYAGPGRDIGYSVQETYDGGYVIAGETDSFGPGLGIIAIRLDAGGSYVWATGLAGDIDADPLHTPFPGVALEQAEPVENPFPVNGPAGGAPAIPSDIVIVGSYADPMFGSAGGLPPVIGGLPIAHRLTATGGWITSAVFVDLAVLEQQPERVHYNFTDVRVDDESQEVVISGSRILLGDQDPTGFPTSEPRVDAIVFKTDPLFAPIWHFAYDTPFDRFRPDMPNVQEWGHGLTIGEQGTILLNGKTDFGSGFAGVFPEFGSFLTELDPGGAVIGTAAYDAFEFDGVRRDHAPAYAAVEFDREHHPVFAGSILGETASSGPGSSLAFLQRKDPMLSPMWRWEYGGSGFPTRGESLTVNRECGYGLAGGLIDVSGTSFVPPNQYIVKTDDFGATGCLEQPFEVLQEPGPERRQTPLGCVYPQLFEQLPNFTQTVDRQELELCYSPDCGQPTGPCNDADVAMPYGVLDLADVQTFLIGFAAMDPVADLNNDGMWNLIDVQNFLIAFGNGCP